MSVVSLKLGFNENILPDFVEYMSIWVDGDELL
jgi:hypothetical protein